MDKHYQQYASKGWCKFDYDPKIANWVEKTRPAARQSIQAPENKTWLRCSGTWFAGVNVLANDENGSVKRGVELSGSPIDFINNMLGFKNICWDKGQISVCYPNYPLPMDNESQQAYRYRLKRDAAHVDGLLLQTKQRRRFVKEHHAFILGIPLGESDENAAPFVIWEESHHLIADFFKNTFKNIAVNEWENIDVTEEYHRVRKDIFNSCKRVEIYSRPGESYIAHRLSLHGVAPWKSKKTSGINERIICYFRPTLEDTHQWLYST